MTLPPSLFPTSGNPMHMLAPGVASGGGFRSLSSAGSVESMHPGPGVISGACIGCRKCERICPVHAITVTEGRASIDLSRCIRCYCCHEMCTEHAITLSRGLAGKALSRLLG